MSPPVPEPLPLDDDEEYTGDFYEEDEPIEKIWAAYRRGKKGITIAPPPDWRP